MKISISYPPLESPKGIPLLARKMHVLLMDYYLSIFQGKNSGKTA